MIPPDELSALIADSDLVCLRCDARGLVTACTAGAEALFGPELLGRSWSELTGEPYADASSPACVTLARVETSSGDRRVSLLFDHRSLPDGGRLSLGRDISEQRAAEASAEAASRELVLQKAALDEHAIVASTDRAGRITYVNDKFVEISGYAREQLLGQDHRIVNSGRHPKAFFQALWRTIAAGEVWRGEICNRAKSGRLYWVDTTIVPFRDSHGRVSEYVAIRADITSRKAHETELSLLASLVHASLDAIIRESLTGTVTAWNPGAEALYGVSAGQALGRPLSELFSDTREATCAGSEPIEQTRRHASGRELLVAETISPVRDELGEVVAWVRIGRDVTQRRRLEARFARTAKLAALGELAGNIAHEINNPIGVVSGKTRLLLQREELSPKLERELTKIAEQCDRIGRLTRGLLDYCRPSDQPQALLDLLAPLRRAISFVDSKAERAGVRIELQAGELPWLEGNPAELEQVFLNLLLNGIDALGPAGGRIEIEAAPASCRGEPGLRVTFRDDGPGIPPELRARVFEPFFTTKGGQGTGLGLAISFGLVERHGGELSLLEEPRQGASFELSLPLRSEPHAKARPGLRAETPPGSSPFERPPSPTAGRR